MALQHPLTKHTYEYAAEPVSSQNLNDIQDAVVELQDQSIIKSSQSLTTAEKTQARANIGAISEDDVGDLTDLDTTDTSSIVDAINEVHRKSRTVIFTTPSFSSLPQTFSDSQVTFDGSVTHLTPDLAVTPNDYKLSNTGAMSGSWELDFSTEGYVTVRGTFSGSSGTTLKVWATHA